MIVCSDGLHNVLEDSEMARIVRDQDVATSCAGLVAAANARGTMDNLTVAVVRMTGPTPARQSEARSSPAPAGILAWLRRRLGRRHEA